MFNTNPKDALPPMRAGERESRAGGEQYCLSPLPLPTDSEYAGDVANIDVHHDDVIMDLRQGASPDTLMTAGHVLSGLALFMNGFFLVVFCMAIIKNTAYSQVLAFWGGGCTLFFCISLF